MLSLVRFIQKNSELLIWVLALLFLGMTPIDATHLTICPLALCGFEHCPGCGLGRSVNLLLHGHIMQSIQMHPLGILTLIVITHRIIHLLTSISFHNPFQKIYTYESNPQVPPRSGRG